MKYLLRLYTQNFFFFKVPQQTLMVVGVLVLAAARPRPTDVAGDRGSPDETVAVAAAFVAALAAR